MAFDAPATHMHAMPAGSNKRRDRAWPVWVASCAALSTRAPRSAFAFSSACWTASTDASTCVRSHKRELRWVRRFFLTQLGSKVEKGAPKFRALVPMVVATRSRARLSALAAMSEDMPSKRCEGGRCVQKMSNELAHDFY